MTRVLIETLEAVLTPRFSLEEQKSKEAKGEYPFIALPVDMFEEQLRVVCGLLNKSAYDSTFVDVGCGIGSKLVLARDHGFRVMGIESSSVYAAIARRMLQVQRRTKWGADYPTVRDVIVEADALTYDYGAFDVIYFYCPLSDTDKQRVLEKRIIETAKPGAYVLANLKRAHEQNVWQAPPMRRVWNNVLYQKMG